MFLDWNPGENADFNSLKVAIFVLHLKYNEY